eukprot:scaffold6600_cov125-Isochrysis_galbana.AAC.4
MYRLFQKSSSLPEVQKGTPNIFSYLSASRILTLAPRSGPKVGWCWDAFRCSSPRCVAAGWGPARAYIAQSSF